MVRKMAVPVGLRGPLSSGHCRHGEKVNGCCALSAAAHCAGRCQRCGLQLSQGGEQSGGNVLVAGARVQQLAVKVSSKVSGCRSAVYAGLKVGKDLTLHGGWQIY